MSDIRAESKHGEITLYGDIVSVKITPDRRVWVRWEGKQGRFGDVGRKIPMGMSRSQKEMYLLQYRNLLLERFAERGYTDKDVNNLAAAQREEERRNAQEREEKPVVDEDEQEELEEEDDYEEDDDDLPPPPPRPR